METGHPPMQTGDDRATSDVDTRVAVIAQTSDLGPVADILTLDRDLILDRWLAMARVQPFHRERAQWAVADHIPILLDAIADFLRCPTIHDENVTAPLDDDAISAAAVAHAQTRFEQGLGPVAVVTEFRILRQEIGRALLARVNDRDATSDIVAGITVIGDALDGAATVGLTALSDRIEELRESFLATTMHDVRQPITLVEGSLRLAERWLAVPDPDHARLAEIVRDALLASAELTTMIDTLSDASRVAMGALEADPVPTSLGHVVREALGAMGPDARARVTVSVAANEHLIGIWDPNLLHRLVANLVGNALKYSAADSPVEVRVLRGEDATAIDATAILEVRDHGIGMSGADLTRVFERFQRTDRARRSGATGLGLGLYACRGIVTAHRGMIVVESDGLDLGTTVTVRLPVLPEDAIEA